MLCFGFFFYYCDWDTSRCAVQYHLLFFLVRKNSARNKLNLLFVVVVVDKCALVQPTMFPMLRHQKDLKQDG